MDQELGQPPHCGVERNFAGLDIFYFKKVLIFILCLRMFYLHIFIYVCVWSLQRPEEVTDPQELKLWMLVSCCVNAGSRDQGL